MLFNVDRWKLIAGNLRGFFCDGPESGCDWVYHLFICRPERVPLKRNNSLGWALSKHVFLQGLNCHAAPSDASDGGKSRVVPSTDNAVVNEPVKFSFGQ